MQTTVFGTSNLAFYSDPEIATWCNLTEHVGKNMVYTKQQQQKKKINKSMDCDRIFRIHMAHI